MMWGLETHPVLSESLLQKVHAVLKFSKLYCLIIFAVSMLVLLNTHDVVRNRSTWRYDFHSLVTIATPTAF